MIHYQLRCGDDHAFDGWFRDSAAFDDQATRGLVECPSCGDVNVRRALMAPAVPRKGRTAAPVIEHGESDTPHAMAASPPGPSSHAPSSHAPSTYAPSPLGPSPGAMAAAQLPDEVRAVLQRIRAEVEKNCDYVGPAFAEEARRIRNGVADVRPIYGETTPEDAEALAEDGIAVSRIPWLPRADG